MSSFFAKNSSADQVPASLVASLVLLALGLVLIFPKLGGAETLSDPLDRAEAYLKLLREEPSYLKNPRKNESDLRKLQGLLGQAKDQRTPRFRSLSRKIKQFGNFVRTSSTLNRCILAGEKPRPDARDIVLAAGQESNLIIECEGGIQSQSDFPEQFRGLTHVAKLAKLQALGDLVEQAAIRNAARAYTRLMLGFPEMAAQVPVRIRANDLVEQICNRRKEVMSPGDGDAVTVHYTCTDENKTAVGEGVEFELARRNQTKSYTNAGAARELGEKMKRLNRGLENLNGTIRTERKWGVLKKGVEGPLFDFVRQDYAQAYVAEIQEGPGALLLASNIRSIAGRTVLSGARMATKDGRKQYLPNKTRFSPDDVGAAFSELRGKILDRITETETLSYLGQINATVRANPTAVGQVLARYPELAENVCSSLNDSYRKEKQNEKNKIYMTHGTIIVAGLVATGGVGAGLGLLLFGGRAATQAVASQGIRYVSATALNTLRVSEGVAYAGTAMGAWQTLGSGIKAQKNNLAASELERSFLSLNADKNSLLTMEERRADYYNFRREALINLGFTAVGLGEILSFVKLGPRMKDASAALNRLRHLTKNTDFALAFEVIKASAGGKRAKRILSVLLGGANNLRGRALIGIKKITKGDGLDGSIALALEKGYRRHLQALRAGNLAEDVTEAMLKADLDDLVVSLKGAGVHLDVVGDVRTGFHLIPSGATGNGAAMARLSSHLMDSKLPPISQGATLNALRTLLNKGRSAARKIDNAVSEASDQKIDMADELILQAQADYVSNGLSVPRQLRSQIAALLEP